MDLNHLEELWELVRSIPPGKCASYGGLGRALRNPASGYFVGRWMAGCDADIPWWRVVAKDGHLPLYKRDVTQAIRQRQLLEREGVTFVEDKVDMDNFGWEP